MAISISCDWPAYLIERLRLKRSRQAAKPSSLISDAACLRSEPKTAVLCLRLASQTGRVRDERRGLRRLAASLQAEPLDEIRGPVARDRDRHIQPGKGQRGEALRAGVPGGVRLPARPLGDRG